MKGTCSSTTCSVTGVQPTRFLMTVFAGWAFVFGYNYVLHMWSATEMAISNFVLATQFLTALVSGFIFTRHYESKGLGEGVRFGAMLGALMFVMQMMQTGTSFAPDMFMSWIMNGFVPGLGLGVVFSLIYRKE